MFFVANAHYYCTKLRVSHFLSTKLSWYAW